MFDKIASDWASKRQKPWAPFANFLSQWFPKWMKGRPHSANKKDLLFLDIGAGSGRNSSIINQICSRLVELDESREMLYRHPNKRNTIQAQMQFLPFRPNIVDGIFSIASIHHIKGHLAREQCLNEMERILKPRGLIVITVWRFFQPKFIQDFKEQLHKCPLSEQNVELGDITVKWSVENKKSLEIIPRFYHLFRAGEFRKFMRRFALIRIEATGSRDNRDNIFFMGEK